MKKVLIVVDMQNDFIDGSLGTKEAQAIVPNVIKEIESLGEGNIVVFTKDTHSKNYLDTLEGKKLPVEHCVKGTNGWLLNEDVRSAWIVSETMRFGELNTIEKNTFGSKELAKTILMWHDLYKHCDRCNSDCEGCGVNPEPGIEPIEEIKLVGLCTDICVISNALLLKAFLPEVRIVVDASCCAGVTPESHKNALEAMKLCQIDIING